MAPDPTTAQPTPSANDTAVVPVFPKARPARAAVEARRWRKAKPRRLGRVREDGDPKNGHQTLFGVRPAIELGMFPDGGGYPIGFAEMAAELMEVDLADMVHLCCGSVTGGRLTIDLRSPTYPPDHDHYSAHVHPDVVAKVQWLPLGAGTVSAFLVDPPYDEDYAAELYGTGADYPPPKVIMRECAHALVPGGRVGFLHHQVPVLPPEMRQVAVYGVYTGPGYRIRAFTVAERRGAPRTTAQPGLDLGGDQ